MPSLDPTRGAARPIAICRSKKPVCPRCGRVYMDVTLTADGKAMLFCHRKRRNGGRKRECGGRAYVIGLDGEYCAVVTISAVEWEQLASARASQILRDLGVLVEAITELHAAGEGPDEH